MLPHQITFTIKNSTKENWGSVSGLLYNIQDTCYGNCNGCAGCPLHRGLDILAEDPNHADIDNDSTHNLDATVALGSPEEVGHPEDPVYNDHIRLTALTREINDLHQRIAAEGQPVETLDYSAA